MRSSLNNLNNVSIKSTKLFEIKLNQTCKNIFQKNLQRTLRIPVKRLPVSLLLREKKQRRIISDRRSLFHFSVTRESSCAYLSFLCQIPARIKNCILRFTGLFNRPRPRVGTSYTCSQAGEVARKRVRASSTSFFTPTCATLISDFTEPRV